MNEKAKEKLGTPAKPIQARKNEVDLSVDLIRLPVAPLGAKYYTHKMGDVYEVKSGKNKGKHNRRNNKIAPCGVTALKDANVSEPAKVNRKMGIDLKHSVTAAMNAWDKDDRIICAGVVHSVDSQGMSRMGIALKQITSKRLYATLLAHGVPTREAKAFADKYER